MMEYCGGLEKSEPAVRVPFEKGRAAMDAYKWDEAIGHFGEAMKHAAGTEQVALHGLVGLCLQTPGRWRQALASFEESARLAEQFKDKQGKAVAFDNIGVLWRERGELGKALESFEAALKLTREIGARREEASTLGNIGLVRLSQGESKDVVLKLFEDALKISQEAGDRHGEASRLNNISLVCTDDKALEYWKRGYKLAREIGAKRLEAKALVNKAFLLKDKTKSPDEVFADNEAALKLYRETGDKGGEAATLANIGGWHMLKGEHEKALSLALAAHGISLELDLAGSLGPGRFRWLLGACLDALGREKFIAECVKAGKPGLEAEKLATELESRAEK
jgi:tetratricopeptide (TPR) repeat protein